MTAGEIIKKLRKEKGYTQTDLAIMLGLKLSTMQKYESGAILNIKVETIRELCHIFDVPAWVFIFPENMFIPLHENIKYTDIFKDETQFNKLYKGFMSLDDDGRKKAAEYIADLKASGKYKNDKIIIV